LNDEDESSLKKKKSVNRGKKLKIKKLDLDFTKASSNNVIILDKSQEEESIGISDIKKNLVKNIKKNSTYFMSLVSNGRFYG
jgi:exosome complex RNA-binding protein Rrp42 (RNase PH superfamily)